MGIIYALLNAVTVALGKTALNRSIKDYPPSVSFFLETFFGIIIWIPFAIFNSINFNSALQIFPIVFLSAILSEAYIFYIYTKGKLSIIASVFATYSIYTVIFSRILNSEVLNIVGVLSICLVILGVLTIAYSKNFNIKGNSDLKSVLWATSGAITVGISDTISKTAIDSTSAGTFLFCLALAQIPVATIYLRFEKQNIKPLLNIKNHIGKFKYSTLAAFLIAVSMIFFWLSFENTLASIASPITSTNVMFTVLFASIFLKEKISRKNLIGIAFIVLGVFVLQIF